jgi:hypothetical protein
MPANLTQQYLKAQEQYRQAGSLDEELKWLQIMLQEIPKHKGTDHLQAKLKSKISQLKKDVQQEKKSGGKKGRSFRIPRQGAGTVVLLGGPNAGKSQLLSTFTNAEPEVAPYPFTTTVPQPGMMPWEDVLVQLIDTPPITKDYLDPILFSIIRAADLALLMVDLGDDGGVEACQELLDSLQQTKTRLATSSYLDEEDVGLSFTRTFVVPNKIDLPEAEVRLELFHELLPLDFEEFVVSATDVSTLEDLRNAVYKAMDVVRVYTKLPANKEPDMDRPFTVRRGSDLVELASQVHNDYAENLKFAKVWGSEVHDATVVKGDYILNDGDIVELHA